MSNERINTTKQGESKTSFDNWSEAIYDKRNSLLGIIKSKLPKCCMNPFECAEDVLHEALINVSKIDISKINNPYAYFVTSLTHEAINSHMRSWHQKRVPVDEDRDLDSLIKQKIGDGAQVARQAEASYLFLEFYTILDNKKDRLVFGFYCQGYRDIEIVRKLSDKLNEQVKPGAVRKRISRIKEKFKVFFESKNSKTSEFNKIVQKVMVKN
jgi:DNA-directed RNA polymerase specialized sigma24 family protein